VTSAFIADAGSLRGSKSAGQYQVPAKYAGDEESIQAKRAGLITAQSDRKNAWEPAAQFVDV